MIDYEQVEILLVDDNALDAGFYWLAINRAPSP